jgi:hypothetical protein
MTLDQRADAATRELLARTEVATGPALAELRALRRRRDTGRRAGLVVAAAALVGGTAWLALHRGDEQIEPAPTPHGVTNGALVAAPDVSAQVAGWRVVDGPGLAHLPDATLARSDLQFTPDGRHTVTVGEDDRVLLTDVGDGTTQVIGTCPDVICTPALSPDGTTLVWSGQDGLRLQEVGRDELRELPLPGAGLAAWPTWSPDGSVIAFLTADGVYTVQPDGDGLRQVQPLPGRSAVWRPVSFSPDGTRMAFLEGVPRAGGDDYLDWVVVTVGVDGSDERRFFDAGSCPCGGQPVPELTWSPDGQYLAVTVRSNSRPEPGIHLIHPDGSGDELLVAGYYNGLAWQPLVD